MLKYEIFKNKLHFISKLEDQFNFVQSPNGNMVVYSLSRYLYVASCDVIKEVKIPEKVNHYTVKKKCNFYTSKCLNTHIEV